MCNLQHELENATLIVIHRVMIALETAALCEQEATSSKWEIMMT
jgi:hypothetical protein